MNAEVIDIGLYIKVPYDLVISKISHRALRVWTLIAAGASPENPVASLLQRTLADQLSCSTDTIGRAIAELLKHGLLVHEGTWNKGRCKSYRLNWNPRPKEAEQAQEKPQDELTVSTSQLGDLLDAHGEVWAKGYDCFDGNSGRPSLRECVDEALANSARAKGANLKTFIDGWLHIASQRWRAKKAPPSVEKSAQSSGANPESDEERAWITAEIERDNDKQRRKDALEALQQSRALARGNRFVKKLEPKVDKPICRENYPVSWLCYKTMWAELQRNVAA